MTASPVPSPSDSVSNSSPCCRAYWPFCDAPPHRIVLKCGSNVLSQSLGIIDLDLINRLALEMSSAMQRGVEIIYVTSGAVSCGIGIMGRKEKPRLIPEKQALAAIGQCRLMHIYSSIFDAYAVKIAQVLLTRADMEDRRRYLNAEYTLSTLLDDGVLPIINENDSVTIDEIKFGDNDGLAALLASKMNADLLVILTDVEGLMSANPRLDPTARLLPLVTENGSEAFTLAKIRGSSKFGSGGMSSKLEAARVATLAGVTTIVANGRRHNVLGDILAGREVGTLFLPRSLSARIPARDRWILAKATRGRRLIIDAGAKTALLEKKKSLLAVGVVEVQGEFNKGDVVEICDAEGCPLAKGLVNFSAKVCQVIRGMKTAQMQEILGEVDYPEVVHRDNLVILPS
jgi:glutamate 5-kinase